MNELTAHEIDELRIGIQKYFNVQHIALEKQIDASDKINFLKFNQIENKLDNMIDQLRILQDFRIMINAKADQRQVNIALVLAITDLIINIVWVFKMFVK